MKTKNELKFSIYKVVTSERNKQRNKETSLNNWRKHSAQRDPEFTVQNKQLWYPPKFKMPILKGSNEFHANNTLLLGCHCSSGLFFKLRSFLLD